MREKKLTLRGATRAGYYPPFGTTGIMLEMVIQERGKDGGLD